MKPFIEKSICEGSKRIIKDSFVNDYRLLETDRDSLQEIILRYEKAQEAAEGIKKYEMQALDSYRHISFA